MVPRRRRLRRRAALLAPSARHHFSGIERADSFVVDPHKWLFAPFDCAALLYREPAQAKAVHTQKASYLDVFHTDDAWNPSDYAYHLTRRARGLALWFSLAVHGTDAYRAAVEAALTTARRAAELIACPRTWSSCAIRSCPSCCSAAKILQRRGRPRNPALARHRVVSNPADRFAARTG